jgi:hypothetical protein
VRFISDFRRKNVIDSLSGGVQGIRAICNVAEQLDLDRLRKRVRDKPRTKAGQLRQAWPDIRDLLAAGHTLKDICAWLKESGLEIGYARLSQYIRLLRLREQAQPPIQDLLRGLAAPPAGQPQQDQPSCQDRLPSNGTSDPLRNLREQRAKKSGFGYDPFPQKGLTE